MLSLTLTQANNVSQATAYARPQKPSHVIQSESASLLMPDAAHWLHSYTLPAR